MITQLDTQFNKFNTQLDTQFDKSIAKLDNYTNTATDNIVGDDRLLDDNGFFVLFYIHGDCFIDEDFFFQPAIFFFVPLGNYIWGQ